MDTTAESSFQPPDWMKVVHILRAAEYHWQFCQGLKALDAGLYVPGALSLLAGIEASIRYNMHRIRRPGIDVTGDLGPVLSNALLRAARDAGFNVGILAFPGEVTFAEDIEARTPSVRIVRIRNDLAHGNIQEFVNRELGEGMEFFTPECLGPMASALRKIALDWADEVARFRGTNAA